MKKTGVFTVQNDRGLHTRPSAELVKRASQYQSEVFLVYQGKRVNAKSLLEILLLAATKGSKITVEAEGVDSEAAVLAIQELALSKFHIRY